MSESGFNWTKTREKAAQALALGHTQAEAAEIAGVTDRTIRNWLSNIEFETEVDRLAVMSGVALKAERLKIVNRVVRQSIREDGTIDTKKDVHDWVKLAQSETDGVKLDLTNLFLDGHDD